MLKEQFEIAASETRIRTSELIEAARLVLVDKESVPDVARKLGISDGSTIHRATASIEKKWEEICEKRDWSFVAIALPRRLMNAMLTVQAGEIDDYRSSREKKNRKKEK